MNEKFQGFWSNSFGWSTETSALLLSKSRLDRQVSLSKALKLWRLENELELSDGELILAWANLGCLIEGSLMLFFSIYREDYIEDRNSKNKDPQDVFLSDLENLVRRSDVFEEQWIQLIEHIRNRRNAIHAFKERDIGTTAELKNSLVSYAEFLLVIDSRLPYGEIEYSWEHDNGY